MAFDRYEEPFVAKTAASEKVRYLYKYSAFDDERLNDLVTNERIPLSRPLAFNDPWDCRVWYNCDLSDPSSIEDQISFYIQPTKKTSPNLSENEIERRAQFFRENPRELSARVSDISRAMNKAVDESYRVSCFSGTPSPALSTNSPLPNAPTTSFMPDMSRSDRKLL